MAAVTKAFLEAKDSISRLKKLSDTLPDAAEALKTITSLASQGIIETSEIEAMVSGYKSNIQAIFKEEVAKAKAQADSISSAAETEVYSKIKGITPIITDGNKVPTPVIPNPMPPVSAAAEVAFLAKVPGVVNDFAQIVKNFSNFT